MEKADGRHPILEGKRVSRRSIIEIGGQKLAGAVLERTIH